MNKLVILFGTTTVAFAGLTLYYANELEDENARVAPESTIVRAAPRPTDPSPSPAQGSPSEVEAPTTNSSVVKASVPKADLPGANAASKPAAQMSASDVDFLAMYADPQGRRTLIDEALVDQRNGMRDLGERLGLTAEHWQRVLEVLAEQQVEGRAASLHCRADPACKSPFTPDQMADRRQAVRDAIGEDKYAEYDQNMSTMAERRTVAELQKHLTGNLALSDQRAEELIAALADERARAFKEMSADGNKVGGIGVPNGWAYYVESAATLDARMATANQFSQRMRDRAATVLSGNQLTAFNQMQDMVLATLRAHLARKEPQPPKPQKAEQKAEQKIARS